MKNKTIKVGSLDLPAVGLGTWGLKGEECVSTVVEALRAGYRLFDTAEVYGNEKEIGIAFKESKIPREKIFVTTKVWPDELDYEKTLRAFDESVKRLDCEYIDVYLLHWPRNTTDLEGVFEAFKKLKKEGKAKILGVSNFGVELLEESEKILGNLKLIQINQIEIYPGNYPKELIEYCKRKNIVVEAYSPLSRGDIVNNRLLKEIATNYSCSAAQLSLAWLIEKGIIVLPKASSVHHLKENIGALDISLTKENVNRIDNMR